VSTNVTLHAGHDVAYFTSGQHRGGCAGAMSYYAAAGEPPGEWAGKGTATLGLNGTVDPDIIERLYQENIGPGGELLVKRRQSKKANERESAAAYLAANPYASTTELAEVRAAERGKDPHQVPYFDLTISAVKSVSVLHASYRVAARQARHRGDQDQAAALDARAGIANPGQAVSLEPHRGNPELEAVRKAVLAALEIRDEADVLRALDCELEALALQGQRVRAAAPPDVSSQLRLTAQAEADAHRQAADARVQHDHVGAASASALVAQLAAERQRLEAANARYEQWSADTHATRDTAGKATAERQRRGHVQPDGEPYPQPEEQPQLIAGWQQLEAAAEAVNCAGASEHQAVSDAEESRASRRVADMNPPFTPEPEPRTSPENEPEQEDRTARLDELLIRADQAAQRIAAQQAERHASNDYAARMGLEAQTQAEAGQQPETRVDLELEPLRRTLSALPDEPVDPIAHQGHRLRFYRPIVDSIRALSSAPTVPIEASIPASIRRAVNAKLVHRYPSTPTAFGHASTGPRRSRLWATDF
jgi:hypothetical protein